MLTTLVLPTGGRAWVAGLDVVADPVGVKRRIGVVTQNNTLDMQLTVAENLEFRSRFFGLSLREASRRAAQLLEAFGLADRRKAMSTDLSGGQAKRLLIARALPRTFSAMMAREFRVLRRNAVSTFTRAVMQPLLFVFVFAYVFPKIGGGFMLGGTGTGTAGAARASVAGTITFATILVPGLMASMLLMQGIMAVTFPLVMEFSWQRTIEDRALAPVPIRVLAIQKIVAGAIQAFLGACIVFPIVLLVHAPGQGPHVHVTNWALFIFILAAASLLTSSLGLHPPAAETLFRTIRGIPVGAPACCGNTAWRQSAVTVVATARYYGAGRAKRRTTSHPVGPVHTEAGGSCRCTHGS
jgi:ABC transporter